MEFHCLFVQAYIIMISMSLYIDGKCNEISYERQMYDMDMNLETKRNLSYLESLNAIWHI